MTDKPDIEAIGRREQSATKRPWTGREWSERYTVTHYETDPPDIRKSIGICALVRPNDADFISRARDDIPDLLAYTETLEKEVERLTAEVERWQGLFDKQGDNNIKVAFANKRIAELEAEIESGREEIGAAHEQSLVDAASDIVARLTELEAENARLRTALTPSPATKAAYMSEFEFAVKVVAPDGVEQRFPLVVPWTCIKTIMATILARALEGKDR